LAHDSGDEDIGIKNEEHYRTIAYTLSPVDKKIPLAEKGAKMIENTLWIKASRKEA
jgi:hypothetical protein